MKKQSLIYSLVAICLMVASFALGFNFSGGRSILNKPISIDEQIGTDDAEITDSSVASLDLDKAITENVDYDKITPSTKMVYEYYYLGDGKVETTEEIPPYFLLDMTEKDMKDRFIDWEVLTFNSDEVIMRKNLQGKSNQYYVVGIHEGYVAVFYATETNGTNLKEITDMPVSAFPEDEQSRLAAGIQVVGTDELIKVLEDYGS